MGRGWKLVAAGAVGVILIAGVGYSLLTKQFTECYGTFKTSEVAERAAEAGRDAGLGASVNESAVTFETGDTGDDAAEDREAFREIVEREDGELGRPGNGCVERGSFE